MLVTTRAKLSVLTVVLWRHRLLEETNVAALNPPEKEKNSLTKFAYITLPLSLILPAQLDCLGQAVCMIGINHELHLRPNSSPNCLDMFLISVKVQANFHLEYFEGFFRVTANWVGEIGWRLFLTEPSEL